ncbi:MAG: hypothetical protein H5U09_02100 [Desulfomicrobiaceae bacterium]|nr:hypothetical protein [Desulfomicrobiaceae bacterium]
MSFDPHWPTLMLSAFFFALLNLSRFCVDTSLLHRPIAAALLWGAATADASVVFIGVFFELLWLDLFPAGAYVPPNGLLAFTLAATTLRHISAPSMFLALAVLLGSALCAHGAANIELFYRKRQDRALMRLADTNRRPRMSFFDPDSIVVRSVAEQWVLGWTLFLVFAVVLLAGIRLLNLLPLPHTPISWPILLAPAFMGGVLCLRTHRALATATASLVAMSIALALSTSGSLL